MEQPEYLLRLTINEKLVTRVIIDQHYKDKHTELNDQIIIEMVQNLDGQNFPIEAQKGEFEYFKVEPVYHSEKPYRLILVLCLTDDFLGVINAFRVEKTDL